LIAHLKTACGASQYKRIEEALPIYRVPIEVSAVIGVAMTQRVTSWTYRVFTLVAIDNINKIAHYEEKLEMQ
jgi:hypothetical protein